MISRILIFISIFLFAYSGYAQNNDSDTYFQQAPPSTIPEIFAPEIISKPDRSEFGSVFSSDGKEFFFGVDFDGRSEIFQTYLLDGSWTQPKAIISDNSYGFNDPFLSPDENKLYYISNRPVDAIGNSKDHDIWYSIRNTDGWSQSINAGQEINSDKEEYYMSFTSSGAMYFSSNKNTGKDNSYNFDIYSSAYTNGKFQKPVKLGNSVNTDAYEADVFVAPDESYLIFCASREEGLGRGDLYISFRNADGSWSPSKNMGPRINTKNHELCPFVTKDGKYFFYTSNQDIYWVSAKILEQYR